MIIALVQARMSSSRLPGKILKQILGKPVIGYLFERLKRSQKIDKLVLATSTNPENDPLADYIQSLGFEVFRGSENNVLERYYLAAQEFKAEHVVRVTGDCPLIDPAIVDRFIAEFLKGQYDYGTLGPSFAEGLDCEVMKFTALKECYQKATLASEFEHLTRYIHNHKEHFKMLQLDNTEDDSGYRIVVDEPQDFEALKILIEDFYGRLHPTGTWSQIKAYLDQHPEITRINSQIIRNEGLAISLSKDKVVRAL